MKKIAIISDTHSFIDDKILKLLDKCNEVWHAGDFGYSSKIEAFIKKYSIKGVHGNIDGPEIRSIYPKIAKFECENLKILMTHIGGYPKKYKKEIEMEIRNYKPDIYICGHSHILKIMYDKENNVMHINPGAAGKEGFHKTRTMVLMKINGKKIYDLKVIELGSKSILSQPIN